MVQLAPIPAQAISSQRSIDASGEAAREDRSRPGRSAPIGLRQRLVADLRIAPSKLAGLTVVVLAVGAAIGVALRSDGGSTVLTELPTAAAARQVVATSHSVRSDVSNDVATDDVKRAATTSTVALPTTQPPASIVVHAAGAVAQPGVYVLPDKARAADVVHAAGGMAPRADPNRINLAAPLSDGSRLFVPFIGAVVPEVPVEQLVGGSPPGSSTVGAGSGASGASGASQTGTVPLNTASVEQLDRLPGIGPATAEAIIAHRSRIGRFSSLNQLLDVPGIGEAKLAAIRKQLTLG